MSNGQSLQELRKVLTDMATQLSLLNSAVNDLRNQTGASDAELQDTTKQAKGLLDDINSAISLTKV